MKSAVLSMIFVFSAEANFGAAQSAPGPPKRGPRGRKGSPKEARRGPGAAPGRPKRRQERPKRRPGAGQKQPGAAQEPPEVPKRLPRDPRIPRDPTRERKRPYVFLSEVALTRESLVERGRIVASTTKSLVKCFARTLDRGIPC